MEAQIKSVVLIAKERSLVEGIRKARHKDYSYFSADGKVAKLLKKETLKSFSIIDGKKDER